MERLFNQDSSSPSPQGGTTTTTRRTPLLMKKNSSSPTSDDNTNNNQQQESPGIQQQQQRPSSGRLQSNLHNKNKADYSNLSTGSAPAVIRYEQYNNNNNNHNNDDTRHPLSPSSSSASSSSPQQQSQSQQHKFASTLQPVNSTYMTESHLQPPPVSTPTTSNPNSKLLKKVDSSIPISRISSYRSANNNSRNQNPYVLSPSPSSTNHFNSNSSTGNNNNNNNTAINLSTTNVSPSSNTHTSPLGTRKIIGGATGITNNNNEVLHSSSVNSTSSQQKSSNLLFSTATTTSNRSSGGWQAKSRTSDNDNINIHHQQDVQSGLTPISNRAESFDVNKLQQQQQQKISSARGNNSNTANNNNVVTPVRVATAPNLHHLVSQQQQQQPQRDFGKMTESILNENPMLRQMMMMTQSSANTNNQHNNEQDLASLLALFAKAVSEKNSSANDGDDETNSSESQQKQQQQHHHSHASSRHRVHLAQAQQQEQESEQQNEKEYENISRRNEDSENAEFITSPIRHEVSSGVGSDEQSGGNNNNNNISVSTLKQNGNNNNNTNNSSQNQTLPTPPSLSSSSPTKFPSPPPRTLSGSSKGAFQNNNNNNNNNNSGAQKRFSRESSHTTTTNQEQNSGMIMPTATATTTLSNLMLRNNENSNNNNNENLSDSTGASGSGALEKKEAGGISSGETSNTYFSNSQHQSGGAFGDEQNQQNQQQQKNEPPFPRHQQQQQQQRSPLPTMNRELSDNNIDNLSQQQNQNPIYITNPNLVTSTSNEYPPAGSHNNNNGNNFQRSPFIGATLTPRQQHQQNLGHSLLLSPSNFMPSHVNNNNNNSPMPTQQQQQQHHHGGSSGNAMTMLGQHQFSIAGDMDDLESHNSDPEAGDETEEMLQTAKAVSRAVESGVVQASPGREVADEEPSLCSHRVNDYILWMKIGSGAESEVYHAVSVYDKTQCFAMKVLKKNRLLNSRQRKDSDIIVDPAIRREIAIMLSMNWNPYVVHFYEATMGKDNVYLRMQLASYHLFDIDEVTGDCKSQVPDIFEEKMAIRYFGQVAIAIAAMNKLGIVHCDIKPHNILYSSVQKKAMVCDFGQAGLRVEVALKYRGTEAFMAPEVYFSSGGNGDEATTATAADATAAAAAAAASHQQQEQKQASHQNNNSSMNTKNSGMNSKNSNSNSKKKKSPKDTPNTSTTTKNNNNHNNDGNNRKAHPNGSSSSSRSSSSSSSSSDGEGNPLLIADGSQNEKRLNSPESIHNNSNRTGSPTKSRGTSFHQSSNFNNSQKQSSSSPFLSHQHQQIQIQNQNENQQLQQRDELGNTKALDNSLNYGTGHSLQENTFNSSGPTSNHNYSNNNNNNNNVFYQPQQQQQQPFANREAQNIMDHVASFTGAPIKRQRRRSTKFGPELSPSPPAANGDEAVVSEGSGVGSGSGEDGNHNNNHNHNNSNEVVTTNNTSAGEMHEEIAKRCVSVDLGNQNNAHHTHELNTSNNHDDHISLPPGLGNFSFVINPLMNRSCDENDEANENHQNNNNNNSHNRREGEGGVIAASTSSSPKQQRKPRSSSKKGRYSTVDLKDPHVLNAHKRDSWALGIVLYCMIFKRHPFDDPRDIQGAMWNITVNGCIEIPENNHQGVPISSLTRSLLEGLLDPQFLTRWSASDAIKRIKSARKEQQQQQQQQLSHLNLLNHNFDASGAMSPGGMSSNLYHNNQSFGGSYGMYSGFSSPMHQNDFSIPQQGQSSSTLSFQHQFSNRLPPALQLNTNNTNNINLTNNSIASASIHHGGASSSSHPANAIISPVGFTLTKEQAEKLVAQEQAANNNNNHLQHQYNNTEQSSDFNNFSLGGNPIYVRDDVDRNNNPTNDSLGINHSGDRGYGRRRSSNETLVSQPGDFASHAKRHFIDEKHPNGGSGIKLSSPLVAPQHDGNDDDDEDGYAATNSSGSPPLRPSQIRSALQHQQQGVPSATIANATKETPQQQQVPYRGVAPSHGGGGVYNVTSAVTNSHPLHHAYPEKRSIMGRPRADSALFNASFALGAEHKLFTDEEVDIQVAHETKIDLKSCLVDLEEGAANASTSSVAVTPTNPAGVVANASTCGGNVMMRPQQNNNNITNSSTSARGSGGAAVNIVRRSSITANTVHNSSVTAELVSASGSIPTPTTNTRRNSVIGVVANSRGSQNNNSKYSNNKQQENSNNKVVG